MIGLTIGERINIAVAVASGLVALATGVLAWKTWSVADATHTVAKAAQAEAEAVAAQSEQVTAQAAATKEQAAIGAAALQAAVRPWLTRDRRPASEDARVATSPQMPGHVFVDLWLRNIGNGLALIPPEGSFVRGKGRGSTTVERPGHVDQPALPAGESVLIHFDAYGPDVDTVVFQNRGQDGNFGELRVFITYTDANGDQAVEAELHLAARDRETIEWRLVTITYRKAGEVEPFASVRFDAAVNR